MIPFQSMDVFQFMLWIFYNLLDTLKWEYVLFICWGYPLVSLSLTLTGFLPSSLSWPGEWDIHSKRWDTVSFFPKDQSTLKVLYWLFSQYCVNTREGEQLKEGFVSAHH